MDCKEARESLLCCSYAMMYSKCEDEEEAEDRREILRAMNLGIKSIDKQIELQDFIGRLDPVEEETLIVILRKYLVDSNVSQNG